MVLLSPDVRGPLDRLIRIWKGNLRWFGKWGSLESVWDCESGMHAPPRPGPENFQDCPAPSRKCAKFDWYPALPRGFYCHVHPCCRLVELWIIIGFEGTLSLKGHSEWFQCGPSHVFTFPNWLELCHFQACFIFHPRISDLSHLGREELHRELIISVSSHADSILTRGVIICKIPELGIFRPDLDHMPAVPMSDLHLSRGF